MPTHRVVCTVFLLTLFCLVSCVGAAPEYEAAGVIAYSRIQGKTYVLLADHRESKRGWGTFGGHREEGETVAEAASREFREETRCVYEQPSESALADEPSLGDGGFLCYVVELPFVPAQVFESLPAKSDCQGPSFEERGPWIWIPLGDVVQSLADGNPTDGFQLPDSYVPKGYSTKLWSTSAAILHKALDEGYLK